MFLEALVPDPLDILLWHNPPDTRRWRPQVRYEIGPGLFQMEAHQRGIDDLDRLEFVLEENGTDPVVALQAELHILGGEWVTVVEGHSLAQLELIREPVFALAPGFG